jgi:nucleotide-binding universal stress UspA family protein
MVEPDGSPGSAIDPGPVIVGVDGSSNSLRALAVAAELARRLDLELVVLHAVGLMTVIDGSHVPSEGRREELERLLREQWCATLTDELRWRAELVDGSPADVVMKMTSELDASLVVVGSRGVGDELALGSTSHHVVHHSDRPVVVVPPLGLRSGDV